MALSKVFPPNDLRKQEKNVLSNVKNSEVIALITVKEPFFVSIQSISFSYRNNSGDSGAYPSSSSSRDCNPAPISIQSDPAEFPSIRPDPAGLVTSKLFCLFIPKSTV
ncbi:hypothetical protein AVEN_244373-1 [Araneus ventricosus]|uniref:Uncharacterized protein n=1 Tax=Araneus ventricosus TaxID=182803 RepID=A0A4Y2RSQ7_ARAVE|nr:hypothetical protein AVEN_260541-1 [Araneus ventricosus]GBN78884.1 hypothetical protein AVEN_244373-1 [Araneus ventricosus]